MQKIIFPLNALEYIDVYSLCGQCEFYRYDESEAIFHDNNKNNYTIYKSDLISMPEGLSISLQQAILGNLQLPAELKVDIGYAWNERLHTVDGDSGEWFGMKYLLYSPANSPSSWIYNKEGAIIFEITPTYPWHFIDF